MTGERIEKLRKEKGWSQEKLAEELGVSRQTIYKWESESANPETDHLRMLVKIFNTSFDYLLGNDDTAFVEGKKDIIENHITEEIKEEVKKEIETRIPTAVCQICGDKIYDHSFLQIQEKQGPITKNVIYCKKCFDNKMQEEERKKRNANNAKIRKLHNSMIRSYILGGIILIVFVIAGIKSFTESNDSTNLITSILIGVSSFTFVGCLYAKNNFIQDMFTSICSWGFVRFPGIIFSLDFDGLIFLITTKILFAILGFILVAITFILALVLSLVISIFVYPYAIVTVYRKPEKTLN